MADKALVLGINHYKNVNSLRGCENDVENMSKLLTEVFGFDAKNVKPLLNERVTKAEVQKQMKWLFRDAREGDRVVLHFSGHGSFTADLDGDETDGADELICLYDMDFNDPDSYFLDDELRRWTETMPAGVRLTVVLDSCHSGTGTRLLLAPETGKPALPVRVDVAATMRRTIESGGSGMRGLALADAAAAALDPQHEDLVRAASSILRRRSRPRSNDAGPEVRRQAPGLLVTADINHVLLAACRDDQTAADATIDGAPNGAFTYNLCKTIRAGGANLERKVLIAHVERALSDGHFSQQPQLEGRSGDGPLFGSAKVQVATVPATASQGVNPAAPGPGPVPVPERTDTAGLADIQQKVLQLIGQVVGQGAALDPSVQQQALELIGHVLGAGAPAGPRAAVAGVRHLVYVHGICAHPKGYSNPWWDSLHPFTTAFGGGALDDTRHEVLWSDLVNARGVRAIDDRETSERAEFAARVRGALEERMAAHAMEAGPSIVSPELARDLFARDLFADRGLSIPGLNCIDDFTVYMFDDSVRAQIVGRFTSVVRPLLEGGAELDIISHSWGTVVAYEGLRELEDAGLTTQRVRDFFTAGAALSIFPVKLRLRPANRDGRKPAMVRRWINLNAHGDPVGGRLQGRPYLVDAEFLNLANMGCGLLEASCAHGSYFKPENAAVNRDIFGNFINRP